MGWVALTEAVRWRLPTISNAEKESSLTRGHVLKSATVQFAPADVLHGDTWYNKEWNVSGE